MAGPITTTLIPSPVLDFYNRTLLERALPHLAYMQFGQKKPVPLNSGERPKFRRYGSLAQKTAPKVEGVTGAADVTTYTDVTGQLRTYGNHVLVTDSVILTNVDAILTENTEILGENAGESLDSICRDKIMAGSNAYHANAVALRTDIVTKIAIADVEKVLRTMRNNKAKYWKEKPMFAGSGFASTPIRASYYTVAHPDVIFDMDNQNILDGVHEYADPKDRLENEVGAVKGLRVVESTNAKIWTGAGAAVGGSGLKSTTGLVDVYGLIVVGQNYFAVTDLSGHALEMIYNEAGSAGALDPYKMIASQAWKAITDMVILNDAFACRYECGATV